MVPGMGPPGYNGAYRMKTLPAAHRFLFGIAAAACAFAFGPAARADIITANFELGTLGSPPVSWTVDGSTVVVSDDQSPIGAPAHDQGLRFTDSTATSQQPAISRTFTDITTNTLYIQFDYRYEAGVNNAGLQVRDGATTGVNIHMTSAGSNYIGANQGSGFANFTDTTLTADEWYRFTLTLQPANSVTDSYSLRVQSIVGAAIDVTYSGLLFQNQLAAFDTVRFHFNNAISDGTSTYSLDNILVTTDSSELNFSVIVPEPGTVSLVLLGLVLVARIGRRRG